MATNGVDGNGIPPKITLYTNHGCPFAHRAHITIKELGLPYEEVIIDLDTPREQWYLDVNPRGLVPSIKYSNGTLNEEIITESAIVAQFLADSFPSHLLPASHSSPTSALTRARIAFFVDTWSTKFGTTWFKILMAATGSEKEAMAADFVKGVEKEIEPLLKETTPEKPFFGGSEKMTFAEVMLAPFILRIYSLSNDGRYMPKSVVEGFEKLPKFSAWAKAATSQESVMYIWDEKKVLERTGTRIEKMKAAAAAK